MSTRLHSDFQEYEIKAWHEMRPGEELRHFSDPAATLCFLHGFLDDEFVMSALRRVAGERHCVPLGGRGTDEELLLRLASELTAERIFLIPIERPAIGFLAARRSSDRNAEASESSDSTSDDLSPENAGSARKTMAGWVTFEIINEETSRPAAGVKVPLKLQDGSIRTHTSDGDGVVHVTDLPEGGFDLEKVFDSEAVEVAEFV